MGGFRLITKPSGGDVIGMREKKNAFQDPDAFPTYSGGVNPGNAGGG